MFPIAYLPNHHCAGVDADAHLEVCDHTDQLAPIVLQRMLNLQGSPDGALWVVFMGDRRAKEGQQTIAEELGNCSFVATHGFADDAMSAGNDLLPFFGIKLFSDGGRSNNVSEEDGDWLALTWEGFSGGAIWANFAREDAVRPGDNEGDAAMVAEIRVSIGECAAGGAQDREFLPALLAEASFGGIFKRTRIATQAFHSQPRFLAAGFSNSKNSRPGQSF
jgi:hypothetical protein